MENKITIGLAIVAVLASFFVLKNFISGKTDTAPTTVSTPTSSSTQQGATLPRLPADIGRNLMENGTYIDMTFNNLPFSMSIDNQAGIRSNLALIDTQNPAPIINPACQPLGKVFYDVNSQTVLTADIMYGDGCNYFLFFVNNQATYANRMTPEAVNYFTNIITQVKVQ